jgi:type VI secretion system protein ImpA
MASPHIIDLAAAISPLMGDSPSGVDPREDTSPLSKYQAVKSARAAARAAERKGMHDGDTAEADEHWRKIISLAPDILASQGKDLEVACWLCEALIRRHGFQGLRDAFQLIHALLDQYWDGLYPMPDEDGIATRTSALSGLNGEGAEGVLIAPIRKVPITEGYSPGPYSLWQYQQALEAQRAASEELRQSKIEKLGFSLDDIEKAVNESSSEFYIDLLGDVNDAISTFKRVGDLLVERCGGQDAPSTRNIIEILDECRGVINHIGRHKLPVAPEAVAVTQAGGVAPTSSAEQLTGAVTNRQAAFQQLLEIAKFFRKTEPHSPVSYVIEKAVKWGNMPLNELMFELIPDSSSRERFSELTGVKNED